MGVSAGPKVPSQASQSWSRSAAEGSQAAVGHPSRQRHRDQDSGPAATCFVPAKTALESSYCLASVGDSPGFDSASQSSAAQSETPPRIKPPITSDAQCTAR